MAAQAGGEPTEGDAFTIKLEGDSLVMQMGHGEVADLSHWHYDTFHVTWRTPLFGQES